MVSKCLLMNERMPEKEGGVLTGKDMGKCFLKSGKS